MQAKLREQQERERVEHVRSQKAFEDESERRTQQQKGSSSASSASTRDLETDRVREEEERTHRSDVDRRQRQQEVQSLVRRRKESLEVTPASGGESRADQLRRQRQEVCYSVALSAHLMSSIFISCLSPPQFAARTCTWLFVHTTGAARDDGAAQQHDRSGRR